jgi:hypothetical protein
VRARRLAIVPRAERREEPGRQPHPGPGSARADDALLDEVDRILDKIHAQGMASLTPGELRLLNEASRRGRSN